MTGSSVAEVIDLTPWLEALVVLDTDLCAANLTRAALGTVAGDAWKVVLDVHRAPRTGLGAEGDGEGPVNAVAIEIGNQLVGTFGDSGGFLVDCEGGQPVTASFHLGETVLRVAGDGPVLARARLSGREGIIAEWSREPAAANTAADVEYSDPTDQVAPEQRQSWIAVGAETALLDSQGGVIGHVQPGTWYQVIDEREGWVAVADDSGRAGWFTEAAVSARSES